MSMIKIPWDAIEKDNQITEVVNLVNKGEVELVKPVDVSFKPSDKPEPPVDNEIYKSDIT